MNNSADGGSVYRILVPAEVVQIDEIIILYFNILYRLWSELTRAYLQNIDFPVVSLNTIKVSNTLKHWSSICHILIQKISQYNSKTNIDTFLQCHSK